MAHFVPHHSNSPHVVDNAAHFYSLVRHAQEEEEELSGLLIQNLTLVEEDLSSLTLRDVVFDHCRFSGCNWQSGDFADLTFHTCDLSGGNFEKSHWLRFSWQESKAMALLLHNCRMYQGNLFKNRLSFSNFDHGKLRDVLFSDGEMDGIFFTQCSLSRVTFQDCDLKQASFIHTPLKNVDLSSCNIAGIVLSEYCTELRGAIVDTYQAADLARRLGIVIK